MSNKSNNLITQRASGIILHITSLPSEYGIGDFGPGAFRFVDFLRNSGQTYWQVLPLNPTEQIFGNSPYSSFSAYAGNLNLISPEVLANEGFLSKEESKAQDIFSADYCDYSKVVLHKQGFLKKAYSNFKINGKQKKQFQQFCVNNSHWLDDYALFVLIKQHFSGRPWYLWPIKFRDRNKLALNKFKKDYSKKLHQIKFFQYLFFSQWFSLKRYCNKNKIKFIGDIPIYVSGDSVDVWANPEIFNLNKQKKPLLVAGVPPDYFSKTGQRWGNPVYSWEKLKKQEFKWWLKRLGHNFKLFDVLRIDHFRGFVAFWGIPAAEETAVNGKWFKAPAEELFSAVVNKFPSQTIIAEDLGHITDDVKQIIKEFKFPGMRILIFAFGENLVTHPYLPHNYIKNCVAYTGTHDNNTICGWLENEASETEKENILKYLGKKVISKQINWEFIRLIMNSSANTAIFPLQDILGLGQQARMNFPSKPQGNWSWRVLRNQLSPAASKRLLRFTQEGKRISKNTYGRK